MRLVMVSMAAAVTGLVLQLAPAYAQQGPEYLSAARRHLKNVESALGVIEETKTIGPDGAKAFDSGLVAYARGLRRTYDVVLGDADRAASTEGREGSVEFLPQFEEELDRDEARVQRLQERVKAIQADVRTGAVRLDAALLESMSAEDLAGFASFLTREALEQYRKDYPHLPFPEWSLKANVLPQVKDFARSAYAQACELPGRVDRALMPPVEAAIAWPCVMPCYKQQWAQCALCVVSAIPGGGEAWNSFVNCWNGSGRPSWVWTWLWKTYCVGAFVARIA